MIWLKLPLRPASFNYKDYQLLYQPPLHGHSGKSLSDEPAVLSAAGLFNWVWLLFGNGKTLVKSDDFARSASEEDRKVLGYRGERGISLGLDVTF
ncbi:MAG: hypothetical protein NT154_09305, partial [Verrucomicrobia bacterium]|nr:hypothetical protein [Verrucomicrobiota bacterium]